MAHTTIEAATATDTDTDTGLATDTARSARTCSTIRKGRVWLRVRLLAYRTESISLSVSPSPSPLMMLPHVNLAKSPLNVLVLITFAGLLRLK